MLGHAVRPVDPLLDPLAVAPRAARDGRLGPAQQVERRPRSRAPRPRRPRRPRRSPRTARAGGRAGRSRSRRSLADAPAASAAADAAAFSVVITSTVRAVSSAEASPRLAAVVATPPPTGFDSHSSWPARAVELRSRRSGSTVPVTAIPYFGSGSSIEWPPTTATPAAAATSDPPRRISRSTSPPSCVERERHQVQRGDRARAHRVDVGERVRRGDPAEVVRVVDDRREEVDGRHDRQVVGHPVDRGVVGRLRRPPAARDRRSGEARPAAGGGRPGRSCRRNRRRARGRSALARWSRTYYPRGARALVHRRRDRRRDRGPQRPRALPRGRGPGRPARAAAAGHPERRRSTRAAGSTRPRAIRSYARRWPGDDPHERERQVAHAAGRGDPDRDARRAWRSAGRSQTNSKARGTRSRAPNHRDTGGI